MLNLKIIDILDLDWNFKTIIELNSEINITISQMQYNSIKSAIPIYWKTNIKDIINKPIGEIRLNN